MGPAKVGGFRERIWVCASQESISWLNRTRAYAYAPPQKTGGAAQQEMAGFEEEAEIQEQGFGGHPGFKERPLLLSPLLNIFPPLSAILSIF